jgi:hypothetical protein
LAGGSKQADAEAGQYVLVQPQLCSFPAAATVFLSDSLGIMRRINTIVRLCATPEP